MSRPGFRPAQRDRSSAALVSLLLLVGLIVGGAGFLSQHYRIEIVPRGQAQQPAREGGVLPAAMPGLEPEVILVDGCEADEAPLLAQQPRPVAPGSRKPGSGSAKTELPPCDEEVLAGSAVLDEPLLHTALLTEDLPPAIVELLDPGVDPVLPAMLPGTSEVGPGHEAYLPSLMTVGALGPRGGGITSLPAQETTGPAGSPGASGPTPDPTAPGGDPTDDEDSDGEDSDGDDADDNSSPAAVAVPEPGSLALLGLGLLAAAVRRKRV